MKKFFLMAFALISGSSGYGQSPDALAQKITSEINQLGAAGNVMIDGHSMQGDWLQLQNNRGGWGMSNGDRSGNYEAFCKIQSFGLALSQNLKQAIYQWLTIHYKESCTSINGINLCTLLGLDLTQKITNEINQLGAAANVMVNGHSMQSDWMRLQSDWMQPRGIHVGQGDSSGNSNGNYLAFHNIQNATNIFGLPLSPELQQDIFQWLTMNYKKSCKVLRSGITLCEITIR